MTPHGRARELEAWDMVRRQHALDPPRGFTGGHGYPDPEIYPWVDRLNMLSRLCTLQSCAGHRCTTALHCEWCDNQPRGTANGVTIEDLGHVRNGQLWLWPDEALARWFYEHAPLLVTSGIEKVGTLWHVEGREIIDIQFLGAGHGQLDSSMRFLCGFFERGNMECNLS
jgi:hypothetical protein